MGSMSDTLAINSRTAARPAISPRDPFHHAPRLDRTALAQLLISGGDSRLRVNLVNNLNDYGCAPLPRPEALSFASSTASTISERAYAAVDNAVSTLQAEGKFADLTSFVERMRAELKAVWEFGDETDVVFAPSGTDAELRALYIAKCVLRPPVISIVVGANETGNGIPLAAAGRHFNSMTANGFDVVKGEPIHGLSRDVEPLLIPTRGADGRARSPQQIDAAVFASAKNAIAAGHSVILHVIAHSKLGTYAPTPACVERIAEAWPGSVQIIVDACQARVSRRRIKSHLAQNRIVLITGSKFFAGPAFSGAMFVPAPLIARAADSADVPLGFLKYTSASDWPARFERLRTLLPPTVNVGQTLRWVAALEEMRSYFRVPNEFRNLAVTEFAKFATESINGRTGLCLLDQPDARINADAEFSDPTVFAFLPMRNGRACSMAEASLLYQALNEDVSAAFAGATPRQRRLLVQCCHIGQPVEIPQASGTSGGALRVSADANLISQSWFGGEETGATERLQSNIGKLKIVFDKLQFLLDHLGQLQDLTRQKKIVSNGRS